VVKAALASQMRKARAAYCLCVVCARESQSTIQTHRQVFLRGGRRGEKLADT